MQLVVHKVHMACFADECCGVLLGPPKSCTCGNVCTNITWQSCREKAPFVLIVETLAADGKSALETKTSPSSQPSSQDSPQPDDNGVREPARRRHSGQYADSVQSLLASRLNSNSAAEPGPRSSQRNGSPVADGRSQHRRSDTASRLPSPPSSPAVSVIVRESDSPEHSTGYPAGAGLTSKRSLSFSEALPVDENGVEIKLHQASPRPKASYAGLPATAGPSPRPSPRFLGRSPHGKVGHADDPLAR